MVSEIIFTIHQSYSLFTFQGNLKNHGIGSSELSWDDVKTIKSGKRSAPGSDISEKQINVYTYYCIEESRIGRTLSHTYNKDGSNSHSWNDEDHAFNYQLDQWGLEKLFRNSDELIIGELKFYI